MSLTRDLALGTLGLSALAWWPHVPQDVVQHLAWQLGASLTVASWLWWGRGSPPGNPWPAAMVAVAVCNLLSHEMRADGVVMTNLVLACGWLRAFAASVPSTLAIRSLLVVCAVQFAAVCSQSLGFDPWFGHLPWDLRVTPNGLAPTPPLAAAWMALGLALCWPRHRGLAAPFLLGLWLTRSWASWVAVLVGFAWYYRHVRFSIKASVAASLTVFTALSWQVWWPKLAFRLDWWLPAFKAWTERWVDGIGIGQFLGLANRLAPKYTVNGLPGWETLHHEPLQWLLEAGILGAVALVGWGAWSLRRWVPSRETAALCGLIVLLVFSGFHSVFHAAGLACAALCLVAITDSTTEVGDAEG